MNTITEKQDVMYQILDQYKLNFFVEKVPIFADYHGNHIKVTEKFATVRTDTKQVLGIVGNRYRVVQNIDKFSIIQGLIEKDLVTVTSGGYTDNGNRVFLQARINDGNIVVNGNDVTETYLTIASSHDGTLDIMAGFLMVRVYCQNSFYIILDERRKSRRKNNGRNLIDVDGKNKLNFNDQNIVEFKHTRSAFDKLDVVSKMLEMAIVQSKLAGEAFQAMANRKITEKELREYLSDMFINKNENDEETTRSKNLLARAYEYIFEGVGQREIPELTAWKAFNGVTSFIQNEYRNEEGMEKLNSVLFGTTGRYNQKAFDLAVEKFLS